MWHLRKGPQMFNKYTGMIMEERDPIPAEWAKGVTVIESPNAPAHTPDLFLISPPSIAG